MPQNLFWVFSAQSWLGFVFFSFFVSLNVRRISSARGYSLPGGSKDAVQQQKRWCFSLHKLTDGIIREALDTRATKEFTRGQTVSTHETVSCAKRFYSMFRNSGLPSRLNSLFFPTSVIAPFFFLFWAICAASWLAGTPNSSVSLHRSEIFIWSVSFQHISLLIPLLMSDSELFQ